MSLSTFYSLDNLIPKFNSHTIHRLKIFLCLYNIQFQLNSLAFTKSKSSLAKHTCYKKQNFKEQQNNLHFFILSSIKLYLEVLREEAIIGLIGSIVHNLYGQIQNQPFGIYAE